MSIVNIRFPIVFKLFRRFASQRDANPRTHALALLERGELTAAEAAFSALLADPSLRPAERAWCVNKRGIARVRQGRHDDAMADFRAALDAEPRFAPALSNIGNLLLEAGRVEEAVAQFEAAIAADNEYAVAHLNLSVALKRLGRIDEAVRALRTAQRLEGRMSRKKGMRS